MILLVCESCKLRDSQITRLASSQYIAFFPSYKTRETHETRTDIFARSESHFPQNSREKNCETRLAVNPSGSMEWAGVWGELPRCGGYGVG
jgi:hypothetical protein